ncbi:FadR/GntR family transcriptional regulator [Aeromicrobium ginsengisoli]|uniref:FadR family transcriptional regulator n=1 Tax=Aeromicrobium ginsengisoli TaxID=363867 RepID=A0A5M4FCH7_9ACTN|nr:FadR/GntR family transcriptional regulator [Aeromicrobium ginsengisoli]KAA1396056.1 FadR family transcriptional regulator [Aeromicrobium ginsengisoli]
MGRPPKNPQPQPELRPIDIDRSSVSQEVIKALTQSFFSGGLLPGHRLPSERQLSESLGVSRSAVRDAIQSLGLLGILDIRQGDGTYLRGTGSNFLPAVIEWGLFLGEKRLFDLVEARQQLEIILAGFAATRRTQEEVDRLAELIELMRDPDISSEAFIEADIEFHFMIAEVARNGALRDVLTSITGLLRAWMARSISAAGETRSSFQEHEVVFEAIRDKDSRGARAAMRRHLSQAERRLRTTLKDDPSTYVVQSGRAGNDSKEQQ